MPIADWFSIPEDQRGWVLNIFTSFGLDETAPTENGVRFPSPRTAEGWAIEAYVLMAGIIGRQLGVELQEPE